MAGTKAPSQPVVDIEARNRKAGEDAFALKADFNYDRAQSFAFRGKIFSIGSSAMQARYKSGYSDQDSSILIAVEAYQPGNDSWYSFPDLQLNSVEEWRNTTLFPTEEYVFAATWNAEGSCTLRALSEKWKTWVNLKSSKAGIFKSPNLRLGVIGTKIYFLKGQPVYGTGNRPEKNRIAYDFSTNTWE